MFDALKRWLAPSQPEPEPRRRAPAPMVVVNRDRGERAYDSAQMSRANSDWTDSRSSANREVREALAVVRSASREAERNHGIYARMLSMHVQMIVGRGFALQSLPRRADGAIDQPASDTVEESFRSWASGPVSADGQHDLVSLLEIAVRSWMRDGEIFLRMLTDRGEMRLQLLEGDYVPERLEGPAAEGLRLPADSRVVNGVEVDQLGRRRAYFIAKEHPGDAGGVIGNRNSGGELLRVPADDVIHLFTEERAGQMRGLPMGAPSFNDLRMLKGYFAAALQAARMNAARPVSVEQDLHADGEYDGDSEDAAGGLEIDLSENGVSRLPAGHHLVWSPGEHPTGTFDPFVTSVTRNLAASWGVSHAQLSRDLRGANFSSMKIEGVDLHRYFEGLQQRLVWQLLRTVFNRWLMIELGNRRLGMLGAERYEQLLAHKWIATPFPSITQADDMEVHEREIKLGIESVSNLCLKLKGRELEDVAAERKRDREILHAHGLTDILEQDAKAHTPSAAEPQKKPGTVSYPRLEKPSA